MGTISDLVVKIGADSSGLTKELSNSKASINKAFDTQPIENMQKSLDGLSSTVTGTIGKIQGMVALAAGGFGLTSLIQGAVDAGAAVQSLSDMLNISAGEAAKFSRILKVAGGDVESAGKAMLRLDKSYSSSSDEGERCRAVLNAVGVELKDSSGKLLPLNEQLKNLSEGYKQASSAGMGQEFIMSTLGARGMALIPVLQKYSQAAEEASKIESIGIDPQKMQTLQMQLKAIDVEAGQLKNSFGLVFAELYGSNTQTIMQTFADAARYIHENKEEIKGLVSELGKLGLVYGSFRVGSAAVSALTSAYSHAKQMILAEDAVIETQLTAQQERAIASRIKIMDTAAKKEESNYYKTLQTMELTEAQKTEMYTKFVLQREAASAESAARVRADMTASYLQTAESAGAVTVANERVVLSENAKGVAASEASGITVKANTASAESANVLAGANGKVAVSADAAGLSAVGASGKMVSSAGKATSAIGNLTKALFIMAGGWVTAAIAAGYLVYELAKSKEAKVKEQEDHEYYLDGVKYTERDGSYYQTEYDMDNTDVDGMPAIKESEVTDAGLKDRLNDEWNKRQYAKPEVQAELKQQELEQQQKELQEKQAALQQELLDALKAGNKDTKGIKDDVGKIKTYTIDVPIGNELYDQAASHEGEYVDYDDSAPSTLQCAAFVSTVCQSMGIDLNSNNVDELRNQAGTSYHEVSDGYVPQKGDIIIWEGHTGFSDGSGNYTARNSTGGVHTGSMGEADAFGFGQLQGYISINELTGNQTVQKIVDENGKAQNTLLQQVNKSKEEAIRLFTTMADAITSETGTAYESGMQKLKEDIRKKQAEINKLSTAGIDTSALQKELDVYQQVMTDKLVKAQKNAINSLKIDIASALKGSTEAYKTAANLRLEATLEQLKQEREERLKNCQTDINDTQTAALVQQEYIAKVQNAYTTYYDNLKKSHKEYISELQNEGKYKDILKDLKNNPQSEKQDLSIDGQKKLASEVIRIWDEAHSDINSDIAGASESLYSSLTSSIEGFIRGTKSAIDIVHSFGNTILSEIAKIAAQKLAGNIISGLFGNMFGGGSSGLSAVTTKYLPSTNFSTGSYSFVGQSNILSSAYKFADGGIVTSPTLGLIGETYKKEAIIPLTDNNLREIGGNNKGGGIVVNITNNSDSQVKTQGSHYDNSINKMVLDIVVDGASRNVNGFNTNLKAALR